MFFKDVEAVMCVIIFRDTCICSLYFNILEDVLDDIQKVVDVAYVFERGRLLVV